MPLAYTLTNDTLFKMLFVQRTDLLKHLVSALLGIPLGSISEFVVINPEIPPDAFGDKFCRLDINMLVDGVKVDLEVQVADEGDFPERSLYYWAREFSSALGEGRDYIELPRTVVISILGFKMFDCAEFHSEFRPIEVSRHEELTDRMSLHYFELPKVPKDVTAEDKLKLWLALFRAKTEEDLEKIERLEVSEMNETIGEFRNILVRPEAQEAVRLRSLARHNEAAALRHARNAGKAEEREKWQGVVADKDAEIALLRSQLAERD